MCNFFTTVSKFFFYIILKNFRVVKYETDITKYNKKNAHNILKCAL